MSTLRSLETSYDIISAILRGENLSALSASREELIRIRDLLADMIEEAKSVNVE